MSALRFSYELSGHGWATAIVADDAQRAVITTSYVGDGLASLLRSVRTAGGDAYQTRHSAIFPAEPDVYMWDFWPISPDDLITTVVRYHPEGELPMHGERGVALFESRIDWHDLAVTVVRTVEDLRDRHSDDYEQLWGKSFPNVELERPRAEVARRSLGTD